MVAAIGQQSNSLLRAKCVILAKDVMEFVASGSECVSECVREEYRLLKGQTRNPELIDRLRRAVPRLATVRCDVSFQTQCRPRFISVSLYHSVSDGR